jgi:hypothetical protein
MGHEPIVEFLSARPLERLRAARDGRLPAGLEGVLGGRAVAEYSTLARQLDESHMGAEHPKTLVFVPGVMGSLLMSRSKGGIWWIDVRTRHHIDDLRLNHD